MTTPNKNRRVILYVATLTISWLGFVSSGHSDNASPEEMGNVNHFIGKSGYTASENTNRICPQIDQALALQPDWGLGHFWKGICLEKKGDLDPAILEFQTALKDGLNARDVAATHMNLGVIYRTQGRPHQASDEFNTASRAQNRILFGLYRSAVLSIVSLVLFMLGVLKLLRRYRPTSETVQSFPSSTVPNSQEQADADQRAQWKIEPELMTAVPRSLERRSLPLNWWAPQVLGALISALVFLDGFSVPEHLKHYYIMNKGVPGTATIEAVVKVHKLLSDPAVYRLVYTVPPSQIVTTTAVAEELSAYFSPGTQVPIHFLPRQPESVALDRDRGPVQSKYLVFLFLFFTLFSWSFWWSFWQDRKYKKLLQWGTPTAGTIKRISGYGSTRATVDYTFGQERQTGIAAVMPWSTSQPGDTVTVMVDPLHPKNVVIYRESNFYVTGADPITNNALNKSPERSLTWRAKAIRLLDFLLPFFLLFNLIHRNESVGRFGTTIFLGLVCGSLLLRRRRVTLPSHKVV